MSSRASRPAATDEEELSVVAERPPAAGRGLALSPCPHPIPRPVLAGSSTSEMERLGAVHFLLHEVERGGEADARMAPFVIREACRATDRVSGRLYRRLIRPHEPRPLGRSRANLRDGIACLVRPPGRARPCRLDVSPTRGTERCLRPSFRAVTRFGWSPAATGGGVAVALIASEALVIWAIARIRRRRSRRSVSVGSPDRIAPCPRTAPKD